MNAPLYLALLHHPVLNRDGQIVTTSVTNLDIHDIARSARTYDIAGYFVAHPSTGLRALCDRVSWHWQEAESSAWSVRISRATAATPRTRGSRRFG